MRELFGTFAEIVLVIGNKPVITFLRRPYMKCPRCNSRMYGEKYYDFVRSFDAWKCICCGELIDSTIAVNRARSNNTHIG